MSSLFEETFVMENDENQPPLSPQTCNVDYLTCAGTLLKESHRNNIDLTPTTMMKGSSKQSPASSPVTTPVSPVEQENTDTNPQCLIEEETPKQVSPTPHNHEDNAKLANQVISDLVDSLPLQIDVSLKLDNPSSPLLSSPNPIGEKQDSHSVCSTDYTPSDSSFDTAREDFQHSLQDTEYESANDFDESSIIFAASSPRDGNTIPPTFLLKNLQTVIPSRNKECLERDKIPLVPIGLDFSDTEWNDNCKEDCIVPFDRESTPTIASDEFLYPIESSVEFVAVDSNDNICVKTTTDLKNVNINERIQLNETDLIISSGLEKCSEEPNLIASSEILTEKNLNSDTCSENSVETVVETEVPVPLVERTEETGVLESNSIEIVVENLIHSVDCAEKIEVGTNFTNFEAFVDAIVADKTSEVEVNPEVNLELIPAEEYLNNKQEQEEEKGELNCDETSENNRNTEELSERLDATFGTVYWQSNYNNCQTSSDKLIVAPEDVHDGIVNHEDSVNAVINQEGTKEVDLEERLQLEAAIVAEELINSSLRENESDQGVEIEEFKSMKDNKMADTENNETTREDSSVESGGRMDENVNPFQTKAKLGISPVRRGSAKLKNGEVSAPTKLNTSSHESPLKKSSSAPKPASSSRTTSSASPKRKGSETTPPHGEALPVSKDQVDVDGDGFKKPLAKHNVSARSSASKVSQNETEAGDTCMMVRSVEDNMTSEAGPDVAEFTDSEFRTAEVFKDAATYDFLQTAGSKHFSESALARMSLYVKFDPLLKAISPVAKRTLSKTSTSDQSQMSDGSDDLLLLGTPTEKLQETNGTPVNKNSCIEGRILDLSPSPLKHHLKASECNSPQSGSRFYSEEEFIQALRMQELLFQEQLLKKDREADEQTRMADKELNEGANRLIMLQKNCEEMRKTVLEYEKTISQLIDDREREKEITEENISALRKERDQTIEDLQGVEKAFGDLHRRFEKSKAAVEGFKKNEEILTGCVKDGQVSLRKQEQKYELLKHHAEETLSCANQEIDALRRSSEVEITTLRAQLKKAEMKVESLEKNLQQMHKENSELTNICDELIAKLDFKH
uniref:Transforming acidic coiled-coil-containing protein C-terminal domain-containing protein n=1 Tax=Strigamia maritima TaxID=126957 RepID=T1IIS1_STRMM